MGHLLHFGASGAQYIDTLFFLLGWDRYGFHKKHVRTPYDELVFFHPVVFVDHIVYSGASGV
jgi:lysozyme family protein